MVILFPSSYTRKTYVDDAFYDEYCSALEENLNVLLFEQPLWDSKKIIKIYGDENILEYPVIYRGWMMKPEEYKLFYKQCLQNNIQLINSSIEYTNCHSFKNGYEFVKDDAPKTLFFNSVEEVVRNLNFINSTIGRFMIKDFVKSVKDTDFPKYFDHPDKEYFCQQLNKFLQYRGNLFTGGIQIKQYLDLKMYNHFTNEFRVFYSNGNPISVSRNSNQPSYTKDLPNFLISKYINLPSNFYTIDFIECIDDSFKVIETGDGGVSGLSPNQNPSQFYRMLDISQRSQNQEQSIEL